MKKVKTMALDLTLALGLLVATGAAAGVLPLKGDGGDIFGGAAGCSNWIYGPSSCSGSGSGCTYTPALCGGNLTAYKSIWQVPCGAYSCGTVWRSVNCASGT